MLGGNVRNASVARYGNYKNGDITGRGGKVVTVDQIYHPEYIGRYATADHLRILRTTLESFTSRMDRRSRSISRSWTR